MKKYISYSRLLFKRQTLVKGFTLIELIIVIAVLGTLSVALLSTVNPIEQFKKSRDAERKTSLAQMQRAIEAYYQDHGQYPASSADYRIVSVVEGVTSTLSWGDSWQPYMNILPKDPQAPTLSFAYYSPDTQTYYLYASVERGDNDPKACNAGAKCVSLPASGVSPCVGICNYGVSSPNVRP